MFQLNLLLRDSIVSGFAGGFGSVGEVYALWISGKKNVTVLPLFMTFWFFEGFWSKKERERIFLMFVLIEGLIWLVSDSGVTSEAFWTLYSVQ